MNHITNIHAGQFCLSILTYIHAGIYAYFHAYTYAIIHAFIYDYIDTL